MNFDSIVEVARQGHSKRLTRQGNNQARELIHELQSYWRDLEQAGVISRVP